ncbi:MAG: hypothetical protein R3B07_29390 [Polyangiaceae bacterium]
MRHWPQDGASDLEQELLELMREDTPEPSEEAREQVFAALSANLGLAAAGGSTGLGAGAAKATTAAKATAAAKAAGTAVTGTQAAAGVGSGVIKLALVGLVLGGATAGVGHFVSSATSGSGGEEQRSASSSQSKSAQGPAHQVLPQGNAPRAAADPELGSAEPGRAEPGRAEPGSALPTATGREVLGRDSTSGGAAGAEAAVTPDVASSVARFGEAESGSARSPAASAASQLEAERAALAQARQALQSGNAPRALGLLTQLSQRYPKLKLSQEHEALSIRALAASGARSQAVARAQRFVALYPNSPLTPGVREVLR